MHGYGRHGQKRFLLIASSSAFAIGISIGALASFSPGASVASPAATAEALAAPVAVAAVATPAGGVTSGAHHGQTALPAAGLIAAGTPSASAAVDAKIDTSKDTFAEIAPAAADEPVIAALSESAADATVAHLGKAAAKPRPWRSENVTVQRGDTLAGLLKRAGINDAETNAAIRALKDVYDPRRLPAGQELSITAAERPTTDQANRQLVSLALDLSFDHQIQITRGTDGAYASHKVERPKQRSLVQRAGVIDNSLYVATRDQNVPNDVTGKLIKLFSWDVDFQRDMRRGDRFETVFEEVALLEAATGEVKTGEVKTGEVRGDLLYAGLHLSGKLHDAYRFTHEDGVSAYYDRTGRSLRKFLLRTPIDGARLSSGFGMRHHPVLGYNRMHKGTDFAAPSGTPIYAGGSGRIDVAGRNGGYGNYIRIRHSGEYSTAYAHLSQFAKGIKPGVKVRQGQVIGYVGTTGRSTGPHLHYEVLRHGQQINAMKVKQPSATKLAGAELEAFQREVARIDRLRTKLGGPSQLASNTSE
jgi:murein DD-endopeptidase MepM/ murein hydrolase activator NlpD